LSDCDGGCGSRIEDDLGDEAVETLAAATEHKTGVN